MNNASFLMKLSAVLFILAIVSGIAGACAWKYWNVMFNALDYGITDFAKLDAENQAMKVPLNLTMYAMPVSFWCAAAGFLAASAVARLMDVTGRVIDALWQRFSPGRSKADDHA